MPTFLQLSANFSNRTSEPGANALTLKHQPLKGGSKPKLKDDKVRVWGWEHGDPSKPAPTASRIPPSPGSYLLPCWLWPGQEYFRPCKWYPSRYLEIDSHEGDSCLPHSSVCEEDRISTFRPFSSLPLKLCFVFPWG